MEEINMLDDSFQSQMDDYMIDTANKNQAARLSKRGKRKSQMSPPNPKESRKDQTVDVKKSFHSDVSFGYEHNV